MEQTKKGPNMLIFLTKLKSSSQKALINGLMNKRQKGQKSNQVKDNQEHFSQSMSEDQIQDFLKFQEQRMVITEQGLINKKATLKMNLKHIQDSIKIIQSTLALRLKEKEEKEEEQFIFSKKKARIQKLMSIILDQNKRIRMKQIMGQKERHQIQEEIDMNYLMEQSFIKREKDNFYQSTITQIFKDFYPLYQSLSSATKEKFQYQGSIQNLSLGVKQHNILCWIQSEKEKRQRYQETKKYEEKRKERILRQQREIQERINQIKVQQFQLQQKLAKTTDEKYKEEIKTKLFKSSLKIKNLESQIKEVSQEKKLILTNLLLQGQKPLKSSLQIEWERIKIQQKKKQTDWNTRWQQAFIKLQGNFRRLRRCYQMGRYIKLTSGKYIQHTRFYQDQQYVDVSHFYQINKFLSQREKLATSIREKQKELKLTKQWYNQIKNSIQELEQKIYKSKHKQDQEKKPNKQEQLKKSQPLFQNQAPESQCPNQTSQPKEKPTDK